MQYNTRERERRDIEGERGESEGRERGRERERESLELDGPAAESRVGILRGGGKKLFTYTEYGQQRRGLVTAAAAEEGRGKKTAKFYSTRGEIAAATGEQPPTLSLSLSLSSLHYILLFFYTVWHPVSCDIL